MAILIISDRDPKAWLSALKSKDSQVELRVFPEDGNRDEIEYALVWNHPKGILSNYPNLKVVASMGAGVDHIFKDPELPEHVKVTRIIDTQLASDMAEFVLALIMDHLRNLYYHKSMEQEQLWKPKTYSRISEVGVGIMGMGHLGNTVAKNLASMGFKVKGWARTKKNRENLPTFIGDEQRNSFLAASNILVCLLPLTEATENILNAELFSNLPKHAFLINVARGKHLVEEDLLEYLDNGHLSGAALDVFRKEPLPTEHPFWEHPQIQITPHIASVTKPTAVVEQVLGNYWRMKNKEPLKNEVEAKQGY